VSGRTSGAGPAWAHDLRRLDAAVATTPTPLAAAVAYSRVHTGVHYPGDAIVGSLIGGALAQATVRAIDARVH
jgi:membrane-associated phospholipid phosphatase